MAKAQSDDDIHSRIWGAFRRFEDWLVGLRPGFGTGRDALRCFLGVESRSPYNWIIPGLGFLVVVALYVLLCLWSSVVIGGIYIAGAMIRIFVFDYTLFFFGLVSGFNMARRWRLNPAQVEELSLVPLTPSVMGAIFASGTIRTWWRYLIVFAVIETIFCVPHIADLSNAMQPASGGDLLDLVRHPATLITIVAILLCPWILAWFHFESIRLAHWMFAAHALPRVPLAKAGVTNFLAMTGLVIGLSGLGSALTGMAFGLLAMFLAFGLMLTATNVAGEEVFFSYSVWMLAAVVGAFVVLWLKRVITRQYEAAFVRSWLLYQWWGAGESSQPGEYPLDMRRAVPYWELYYRMKEEEAADIPLQRRVHTRRYQRYAGNAIRTVPRKDPGGGVPVSKPDELSTPEPANAAAESPSITSDKS